MKKTFIWIILVVLLIIVLKLFFIHIYDDVNGTLSHDAFMEAQSKIPKCKGLSFVFDNNSKIIADNTPKIICIGISKIEKTSEEIDCPMYSSTAPGWCADGIIIPPARGADGCYGHPTCQK